MKLAGAATASGQSVTFKGAGDFDSKNKLGSMTVDFSTGGLNGTIDEISDGTDVYIKSDLLSIMLPEGKTWIKVDLTKTAKSTGVGISSFLSQDPAQALTRLLSVQSVTKVGDVQLDGAPATLYRGRIDLAKAPAGAAATGTGRYQVWIGEDGYVHRVKAIVHSSGTISTVTSDLSAFGEPVSVDVPSAAETFDGSNSKIPGLGG
jgi:hypothetical protein